MVFGILTGLMRKRGSHTPAGNFSSKRGNKDFYKGKGGNKYGKLDKWGGTGLLLDPIACPCAIVPFHPRARAAPPHALRPRVQPCSRSPDCQSGTCPI